MPITLAQPEMAAFSEHCLFDVTGGVGVALVGGVLGAAQLRESV